MIDPSLLTAPATFGRPVCRLGLAARGDSALSPDDVFHAVERGVNFLNWPGVADGPSEPDGMSTAIASLGERRESVVVCVQFGARRAADAADELRAALGMLRSSYVDVLTLYYVETADEWAEITAPEGALAYLRQAQRDGLVRRIGITSHQRPLAAQIAASGLIDLLMIRYNAAHRGAEQDIFPVTLERGLPVITYTALRWGALLQATPDDPPGFHVRPAPAWYRFCLQNPAATVTLAAPGNRRELDEALTVLDASGPLDDEEYAALAAHGERIHRHAGRFP
jgi:predicted aldo/keto reductase-like oxidoreductase